MDRPQKVVVQVVRDGRIVVYTHADDPDVERCPLCDGSAGR